MLKKFLRRCCWRRLLRSRRSPRRLMKAVTTTITITITITTTIIIIIITGNSGAAGGEVARYRLVAARAI